MGNYGEIPETLIPFGFDTWVRAIDADAARRDTINALDYGAVGGGVDETTELQDALDAGAGKRVVLGPGGVFAAYALKIHADTVLDLNGATLRKIPAAAGSQSATDFTGIGSPALSGFAPLLYADGNNVMVVGGTIDGNRSAETEAAGSSGSFGNLADRAGILASTNGDPGVTDITVLAVAFRNMFGCAIDLDLSGTVIIANCRESNAGSIFANIGGDVVNFLTRGTLVFGSNVCAGNRSNVTPANPVVLDRKHTLSCNDNTFDERLTAESGGCKIQDSHIVTCNGNTFTDTYLKPQSADAFYGESFTCNGNTFYTSSPSTHRTGVHFGKHRVKTLTITGNAVTNGKIAVERSSDAVTVSGNTIKCHVNSRFGAETSHWALSGGANQNSDVAGRSLIAGNVVDLNGLDGHAFYQAPGTLGDTTVRGNTVTGADSVFDFRNTGSHADARIRIVGNTIRDFRSLGRITPNVLLQELTIKDNVIVGFDITAPTDMTGGGQTVRRLWVLAAAADTVIEELTVEGNVIHCREVETFILDLDMLATTTIEHLVVKSNVFNVYDSVSTGYSMRHRNGTVDNLWVKDNISVGDMQFGGTITAEFIDGNTFTTTSPARGVKGTTKSNIEIPGDTSTTVGAAGAASALPANPTGYLRVRVGTTFRKVPFYAE